MSAIINIPFNFQPVNTGASSGTYTVPAGKYARVSFNCSTSAWLSFTGNAVNLSAGNSAESNMVSGFVWLKSGDVISVSNVTASGSFTHAGAGTTGVNAIGEGLARILLNGIIFARAVCRVSFPFSTNSSQTVVNISGNSEVNYSYEEYINIS